jgi:Domain of unknown function (DUF6532)
LKKTAISTVPVSYSLVPPLSVPIQECAAWIKHAAAELIKGSFFLWFGVDEQVSDLVLIAIVLMKDCQGRTQNFAHPARCETVISFFYTGPYRIARRMPEIFRTELPLSCLALVAAVVTFSPLPILYVDFASLLLVQLCPRWPCEE